MALEKLAQAARELLDLTGRNRLLNTPRRRGRSSRLEIVDELSEETFHHLVVENKAMSFLPAPNPPEGEAGEAKGNGTPSLAQPEDDNGVAQRHRDDKLQTTLTSEALQKRLLKTYYDARTFEEEQGVNILYLALGFLKWIEADGSRRERHAPLLLVPVRLDRRSARAKFNIRYTDDEIATNLSLQEKLRQDFGIRLPDVPDAEDLSPADYFASVADVVSEQPGWEVLPNDMVLWFFSFSKFLMYRDLQAEAWPEDGRLEEHPLVSALLHRGFAGKPPLCGENDKLDALLPPREMVHVLDADSSQAVAIEEVKRGRNLVIQGPPGTGKSQTIANMIAAAVHAGRRVLFVAEKMAALEVVHRRLEAIGLGDLCLELHSHKANKRAVLDELGHTLELGRPKTGDVQRQAQKLQECRAQLNRHAEALHAPLAPSGRSPFQILGHLVRLRAEDVPPADFALEAALSWSEDEFRRKSELVDDVAGHLEIVDDPSSHPWRGVQLEAMLPTDVERLKSELPERIDRLSELMRHVQQLGEMLQFDERDGATARDAKSLCRLAERLSEAPPMDRAALANEAWSTRRDEIAELVQEGQTMLALGEKLSGVVAEAGWQAEVAEARRELAAYGRGSWIARTFHRVFTRRYREALAALRGILCDRPPKATGDKLAILDQLMRWQKARRNVEEDDDNKQLGKEAFGSKWRGEKSDFAALAAILQWETECRRADLPENFRQAAAAVDDPRPGMDLKKIIDGQLPRVMKELDELFERLRIDAELESLAHSAILDRLESWRQHGESLTSWIAYFGRWSKLPEEGMGELADRVHDGRLSAGEVSPSFEMAYYEALMREVFRTRPEVARFNGDSHEPTLQRFVRLDQQRLDLGRREVALAHYDSLPKNAGDIGEVGLVKRELKKKRRHLPLRQLLSQAGRAVQAVKPVFMMSPISVAQFLEPGAVHFDLLLIDEASQVRPVDALGAIARAGQMVVVGDDKQLPPTRFFSRIMGEEESDEDGDDFQAGDLESILGLCEAQGMPQRMLRWHYRSRHHSLIAVSNREFYDEKLYVIPNPAREAVGMGLEFRHVAEGTFDRGGTATNLREARAVADAILQHARETPDKSLGVGVFSVSQRDAVLAELEQRRRDDPELESFFDTGVNEPFFVKNLENIQGDERDCIFISVAYAPDAEGRMTMNFGPLNQDGGERRLNVLITRARRRCVVFSSITAEAIDVSRASGRGPRAFKTFLEFAASGGVPPANQKSGGEGGAEFERQVAAALAAQGHEVHSRVGVAGLFVDLAVVDPKNPDRYLLGIECDGPDYHAARWARDRDRLRPAVLADRGWIIHRVWSTDWFQRPDEQLARCLEAIERAKGDPSNCKEPENDHEEGNDPSAAIERSDEDPASHPSSANLAQPYLETAITIPASRLEKSIHELPPRELTRLVTRIVKTEGPIHQEEIARRLVRLWDKTRTTNAISDAVEAALCAAKEEGRVVQEDLFFSHPEAEITVRNREAVESSTLRRVDFLPPAEIRAAVLQVVRAHLGAEQDDTVVETARLFGFRATSPPLREAIEDQIQQLRSQGELEVRNARLYETASAVMCR